MIKIIQTTIIAVAVIVVAGIAGQACASASLVGQSAPDDQGYVMCYYEDFNTGEQYIKRSLYACSSQ